MIPEEKEAAVSHALQETFGVAQPEDIRDLTERPGSNRAFRIIVQQRAYLLRINTRPGDMARQFTCMRAAADAGLAPPVHYTSVDDRISITDFVNAQPLPAHDALHRLPTALRALHSLPPFPFAPFNTTCTFLLNASPAREAFLQKFRASNTLPADTAAEVLARYDQLAASYSCPASDMVPAHNDLFKPDNILFDGARLWFVDWEASFQNDRYADLAVVANMLATNDADQAIYLQQYFGAPPDEYQNARLYLMKQVAHIFYAMAFLTLPSSASSAPIDLDGPAPAYVDFQRRFWTREAGLSDDYQKSLFGRVHLNEFLRNAHLPHFDQALRVVSSLRQ
jgi:hypothetical protein